MTLLLLGWLGERNTCFADCKSGIVVGAFVCTPILISRFLVANLYCCLSIAEMVEKASDLIL